MQGVCMYHLLFGKEEGKHAQQHVQACVRMVYMLHLYVHIHWISLFYAQDVNTSCAAYPHWTWLEPSGSAAHQSDKQNRRTASLLCILGCRCRQVNNLQTINSNFVMTAASRSLRLTIFSVSYFFKQNIGAATSTNCANGAISSSQLTTVLVTDQCGGAHSNVLCLQHLV